MQDGGASAATFLQLVLSYGALGLFICQVDILSKVTYIASRFHPFLCQHENTAGSSAALGILGRLPLQMKTALGTLSGC